MREEISTFDRLVADLDAAETKIESLESRIKELEARSHWHHLPPESPEEEDKAEEVTDV